MEIPKEMVHHRLKVHLGGVVSAATLRPVNPHINKKEDTLFQVSITGGTAG